MTSVHRRIVRGVAAPLLAVLALAFPVCAQAARVLVMGPGGHVTARQDQFVPTGEPTPAPPTALATRATVPATRASGPATHASGPATHATGPTTGASALAATTASATARPAKATTKTKTKQRKPPQKTVASELGRLRNSGAITPAQYSTYNAQWGAALASERRLRGTRATELEAVIENMHNIATAGKLTPGRLPALFETLDVNRDWWTTGPLLSSAQYVEFSDSQLVWEYYPGQGIELQVLATFGKADGLYTGGPSDYAEMRQVLSEIIPLAVNRAGGLVWEYYFRFDGGVPPWTSAMSQGTGIEALTRASEAFDDPTYLTLAHEALPVFTAPPPVGVRVPTSVGARYVQYTFEPNTLILNAFLQSLIGLYDYAQVSHDPEAQQLFAQGNAEAEAEVPRFDTGAWSLYQPGVEDTLSYHELVTGFLEQLCTRTKTPVYCVTAQHFTSYLTTPPALTLVTTHVRKGKTSSISFQLSKISRVGIVVIGPGGNTLFSTSGNFGYGTRSFSIPALKHAGTYTIHMSATDLAGNFNRIAGTVQVS